MLLHGSRFGYEIYAAGNLRVWNSAAEAQQQTDKSLHIDDMWRK